MQMVTEYCLDRNVIDQGELQRACRAVLDVVLPRARTIDIDAISDVQDLPPAARAAQIALLDIGRNQGPGNSAVGIALDPGDATQVELLREFASWSINVELFDEDEPWLVGFSDSGLSVCFNVTEIEADKIVADLGDLPVVTIKELHSRGKR
ncbi:MAG: hypothetical protein ABI083_02715 [Lapillicoccus sp.]